MRTIRELINWVDSFNATNPEVLSIEQMPISFGELKNLTREICRLTPCSGDAGCDGNCNEDCFDKDKNLMIQHEEPLGIIPLRIRKVTEGKKPKNLHHFESNINSDCSCIKCEKERFEQVEKNGFRDASWADKKIIELLMAIVSNTTKL